VPARGWLIRPGGSAAPPTHGGTVVNEVQVGARSRGVVVHGGKGRGTGCQVGWRDLLVRTGAMPTYITHRTLFTHNKLGYTVYISQHVLRMTTKVTQQNQIYAKKFDLRRTIQ
jgi:hypothetical protein